MRKMLLTLVIAVILCGPVLAQIDPSIFSLIAAVEREKEKERKQKIYIGLGLAAILIAWGYLIRKKNTSKKCPKCGELVKKEAVICKHCGNQLSTDPQPSQTNDQGKTSEQSSKDQQAFQDSKYKKELEQYNIGFDVSTQRYIFQNQRYFDAETAVLAAQADEQRAKSKELELNELAKYGIHFDGVADRYIYQGRRYMEAKEALNAAESRERARRSGTENTYEETTSVDTDRPPQDTISTVSPKENLNKQGLPRFKDDVKDEPIATENTSQEPILRSKRFFLGVALGGITGATSAWFLHNPIRYPEPKTLAQKPNSISLSKPTVPFEKRTLDSIIMDGFATQGVFYEEGKHSPSVMPRTRMNVSLIIDSDGYADFSVDNLKGERISRSYAYFGPGKDSEKKTYFVFRLLQDPEIILAYNFKEDTLASVNKRTTKGIWVKFESTRFYDRK